MSKIDYTKEFKSLYNTSSKEVLIVDVPEFNFLMVDGSGSPSSQQYLQAVEALFAVSYALKFMVKRGKTAVDYGVLPLEGLWWAKDMTSFIKNEKDVWEWTSMIMQPPFVSEFLFGEAVKVTRKKKNLEALSKVRFERFHEGLSAQIMHLGPYSEEKQTIETLHGFIKENGYEFNGKHHEIYLSDPRKAAPENLRTILRQPINSKPTN
jgi:hypothetical protein